MKTKLPQIGRDKCNDEEVRDTDRVQKCRKYKMYTFTLKRHAE